jgi:hypothetical protein
MGKFKDLQIEEHNSSNEVILDDDPTQEEEEQAFSSTSYPTTPQDELNYKSQDQDIKERKKFADRAYEITQLWIWFLVATTIAQFIFGKSTHWGLDNTTFNIIFTSATASVFGYWSLVGKYLFNTKKD